MSHYCCECGDPADLRFEVDGTGRSACSRKCEDLLLGRGVPEHKRRGWYCKTHKKERDAASS